MSETLEPVTQLLFSDDFAADPVGPVSSAAWNYATGAAEFIPSTVPGGPGTELRPSLPGVSDGALRLPLQTYNPTSDPPGTSFQGSDIFSNQSFQPAPGQGIAFTAVAELDTAVPGMVGGIFAYESTGAATHNEIDFELLGDVAAAGNNQVQTNIYANGADNSVGNPTLEPDPGLTGYQTYTIEWFTNRVLWFVNGVEVGSDATHVPQGAMQFYLNTWAYDATSAPLQPTADSSANATFTFNVLSASVADIACYRAGVRIATPAGERAVETVAVGDLVLTSAGALRPVAWVGQRHLDCRRRPRPNEAWPVRVCRDAFGAGRPRRDLWLSPDHAVFVDGVLIPVRYLINAASIVQVPTAEVTYCHVGLARHALLIAEGMPCESYLDTGNRRAFPDREAAPALPPDRGRQPRARRMTL